MIKREEQRKRREYSLRLREHMAQRATFPECRLLQLKIDCLCAHQYVPDSEEARAYLEKAKKYTLKQRLHFINLYMKQYDELLYEGFSTGEGEKIKKKRGIFMGYNKKEAQNKIQKLGELMTSKK